eukprot:s1543_g5.t1
MTPCTGACQTGASARLPAYWSVIRAVARPCKASPTFPCKLPVHLWLAYSLSLSLSLDRKRINSGGKALLRAAFLAELKLTGRYAHNLAKPTKPKC